MTKIIKIDITDWVAEHDNIEPDISNVNKLVELSTKYHTAILARLAIVAREKGLMPEDIIPPNKVVFQSGAWRKMIKTFLRDLWIEWNEAVRQAIGKG